MNNKIKKEAEIRKQNLQTYEQLKTLALNLNKVKEIDKKNCISIGGIYCCDINFLGKSIELIGRKKLKQLCEWGI